ncbi:MAG: hypothetical protein ACR2KV_12120 [Solirubrobacteraceae bacterium]
MTVPGPVPGPGPVEETRLVQGLLRLYPAGWRERYAEEFAEVLVASLARGERTWQIALDVLAGALDARLHPSITGGTPMPHRVRSSAQVAFFAFVAFCLAGAGFQKMSEDPAFTAAAHVHPTVGFAYGVVFFGAIAAALAVFAGSLPVLVPVVRQALAGRRDLRRRLLIGPLAVAAWIGVVLAVTRLAATGGVHSAGNVALFLVFVAGSVIVCAGSAAALVTATRRADLPARVERVEWLPMIGLSLAMAAVTGADLAWGLRLESQAPALFHSHNGILATDLPLSWLTTVGVMGLATAVAVAATVRAIRLVRGGDPPQSAGLISPVS